MDPPSGLYGHLCAASTELAEPSFSANCIVAVGSGFARRVRMASISSGEHSVRRLAVKRASSVASVNPTGVSLMAAARAYLEPLYPHGTFITDLVRLGEGANATRCATFQLSS